jgi:enoyl-CoA hydratase/carnithine racemase
MTDLRTPSEALALLGGGLDDTMIGVLAGEPVLAIDLRSFDATSDHDVLARLALAVAQSPVVVVGVAADPIGIDPASDPFDVLLCSRPGVAAPWVSCGEGTDVVLDRLVAAIDRSPNAATALVQVLRVGESADVADAVVAESLVYSLLQGGPVHREWLDARVDRRRHPRPGRPVVDVTRHGSKLRITLNRPEVRNAYGTRMRDELVEALGLASIDPTITVVELRGAGPAFCSGGDLDEFGTASDPLTAHVVRTTRNAGIVLSNVAERVVVYVHGPCVGAGVELPAFAARVVAHPGTTFLLPEISMGLVPGAGGTASIPKRIGRHRTAWLALVGEPVDAMIALDWGLVDAIDDDWFDRSEWG